jgi:myosin-5
VIRSTPLLETFGNSKTLRNNNSSRFGKFTQVLFDREGSIVGSRVDVYLLEKSRVVHQLVGERNYHVFYQLLGAMNETLPGAPRADGEDGGLYDDGGDGTKAVLSRADLGLPEIGSVDGASQFEFLAGSECYASEGIDDAEWFAEMVETMTVIGISTLEQQQMLRVIAAVMQIGQISFESAMGADGNDRAVIVGGEESPSLCLVSKLLSCTPADLQAVLETRQISARTETYTVNLNKSEAEAARDALGKALYDKLFGWIVGRINQSTAPVVEEKVAANIGVLDIFGFESFGTNSLEQLLINFANEKLQQQFTWYVFKLEQQEYEKEGIVWNPVDFKDNQPILDVLEGHNSVLALLDEECRLQNGSDDTFVEKLRKQAKRLPKVAVELGAKPVSVMTFPKMSKEPMFILRHYAGEVNYSAESFRDKNKDSVHPDMLELVQHGSADSFINNLFPEEKPAKKASGRGGGGRQGGRKMVTLGSSFKEQLTSLVKVINSTTVHYVRCIKPNFEKSTDKYDLAGVSSQLRCQGILEAIRISRAAYPNRLAHAAVLKRFQMCLRDETLRIDGASEKSINGIEGDVEKAKALLAHLKLDPSLPDGNYQIGNTKCFFRREAMEALEAARGRVIGGLVICVQAEARGWLTRRKFARMKVGALIIQRCARGFAARTWVRRHRAAIKLQAAVRSWICKKHLQQQKAAAITLQCSWRVRTAKRTLYNTRRNAAATRIQSHERGLVQRRAFAKLRDAAIVCQREARRTLCRLRFVAMVDEARQEAMLSNQVERLQTALAESEEAREALEAEVRDLRRQLQTVESLREHAAQDSAAQVSEGVPPKPMVPSGGPPQAVVKAVVSPRPVVPTITPSSPRVPAGGPPKVPAGGSPKVPAGGPPKVPAGGPPKVPAGGPPKVPAGGPPKVPTGGPPKVPAGGPPKVPAGGPPQVPAGGPPKVPTGGPPSPPPGGPLVRQGSGANGIAALNKLETEVASLRKKLSQQKKSYEDALKRKDEKLKKIEKQQKDATTKQAKAIEAAGEATKENLRLENQMAHFSAIREERDKLKVEKATLQEQLEEERLTVDEISADLEKAMEQLETAKKQALRTGTASLNTSAYGPGPEETIENVKKAARVSQPHPASFETQMIDLFEKRVANEPVH